MSCPKLRCVSRPTGGGEPQNCQAKPARVSITRVSSTELVCADSCYKTNVYRMNADWCGKLDIIQRSIRTISNVRRCTEGAQARVDTRPWGTPRVVANGDIAAPTIVSRRHGGLGTLSASVGAEEACARARARDSVRDSRFVRSPNTTHACVAVEGIRAHIAVVRALPQKARAPLGAR